MLLRKLQHCSRNKMQRVMTCLNQMLWKRHPEKAHILHEFQLGHGLSVHSSAAPQEERRRSKAVDDCLEGDPYCALTTSISFQRFMLESLAWEKWSCFSNNRYLEEA
ncbi:hypothetical protein LOK49_LG10G00220 [Camellia lanceoleosa]|uniref:Uncharacterized protein n=1 Tax=Camellia lanceoleosa TaxID=1840588 RepID=A0ACC0GDT0_9ERIC|nr:hypothetical protein LOK49_LG10G00220 [Camellia lanceoleosa]